MKILHLNTSDASGGAARAAIRLHQALRAGGVESSVLVQSKTTDEPFVIGPTKTKTKAMARIRPVMDRIPVQKYKSKPSQLYSPAWLPLTSLVQKIEEQEPDIVHLHWINDGMLSIREIAKIGVPIVWSLHDMWPFTGGCHYDAECGKYVKKCGSCPALGSKNKTDLSTRVFEKKSKAFKKAKDLTIIGLSKWLENCARQSSLFHELAIFNIPNPINTDTFSPMAMKVARELLGLPKNKKLILFGAMNATSDPRKGFVLLAEALNMLNSEEYELLVFGSSESTAPKNFKLKTHVLGRLHDDISLRLIYNAADVLVAPSVQENLSNVIMESLACGTPVVAFAIGGNSDLVDHKLNGYLAKPYETTDLAGGIRWVLSHSNPAQLADKARIKVTSTFDSSIVAKQYLSLYSDILNG